MEIDYNANISNSANNFIPSLGTFSRIPSEVLLYIFSLIAETKDGENSLFQLSQTSTDFRRLANDPSIWKIVADRLKIELAVTPNPLAILYQTRKQSKQSNNQCSDLHQILSFHERSGDHSKALEVANILAKTGDLEALEILCDEDYKVSNADEKEVLKKLKKNWNTALETGNQNYIDELINYFIKLEEQKKQNYSAVRNPFIKFHFFGPLESNQDRSLYLRVYYLHLLAKKGHPLANLHLGLLYKDGFSRLYESQESIQQATILVKKEDSALTYLQRAAQQGELRAHYAIVELASHNFPLAHAHLQSLIKKQPIIDNYELGILYGRLYVAKKMNPKAAGFLQNYYFNKAVSAFLSSAENGNKNAYACIAQLYNFECNAMNILEAIKTLHKNESRGNLKCQLELGSLFSKLGTSLLKENPEKSQKCYFFAAQAWRSVIDHEFYPEARYCLAELYLHDLKDYKSAFECFEQAARGKSTNLEFIILANYKLAKIYSRRISVRKDQWSFVKPDSKKARELIQRAKDLMERYPPALFYGKDFGEVKELYNELHGMKAVKRKRED